MAVKISRKALAKYLVENSTSDTLASEVAALLIDSNQTAELDSLMRDLNAMRSQVLGIVEVTARSAFSLDQQAKNEIEQLARKLFPSFKELIIHEEHDKTVIGGVNLNFPGMNVDLTLRRKLNKLKELAT